MSPRAVMRASSRRGWRWTIRAASAPANPLAPAMRIRGCLLTERAPDSSEGLCNAIAHRLDLVVRERSVLSAELEPQREALVPLGDLLAAIEVEDLGVSEKVAARLGDRRPDALGWHVLPHHDREVLEQSGVSEKVLVDLVAGRSSREERRDVELERNGCRQVPPGRNCRVQLAQPAGLCTPEGNGRSARRMEERLRRGLEHGLSAKTTGNDLDHALQRIKVGGRRL